MKKALVIIVSCVFAIILILSVVNATRYVIESTKNNTKSEFEILNDAYDTYEDAEQALSEIEKDEDYDYTIEHVYGWHYYGDNKKNGEYYYVIDANYKY